jgi:hypothetical protein
LSPKSLEKKVEEAAGDIGRGAKKAGEAIEEKAEDIGKAVGKGAHDLKKGIEKEKKKLEHKHRG